MSEPSSPSRTRTAERAPARRRPARVARLLVVHGPDRGASRVLTGERLVVGREGSGEGALELHDAEVSRGHLAIEVEGAAGAATLEYLVEDQGSRNGVHADGARVTRARLRHGTVVRLGSTLLLFDVAELPAGAELDGESDHLPGPSLALGRIRAEIRAVAGGPAPVLILGDSGTGKERIAEELHRQSGRSGPFVPINCAAISAELAESELFGHVAGAFTGATSKSPGVFMSADRGTLFLDEIGELPTALQPKLLRALAKGEVRPVGSAEIRHADVRIVAATHRDLERAAREGGFRGDLLARLSGWTITVPPLVERKQDVLALAQRFLLAAGHPGALTADAAEALLLHPWRYNVRELEQVVGSAVIRARGEPIDLPHLPRELARPLEARGGEVVEVAPPLALLIPRDRAPTADELRTVLDQLGGSISEVAAFFGKDRKQVYRWMKRHEIVRDDEPEA